MQAPGHAAADGGGSSVYTAVCTGGAAAGSSGGGGSPALQDAGTARDAAAASGTDPERGTTGLSFDGRWRWGTTGTWYENWDANLVTDRTPPNELVAAFDNVASFERHPQARGSVCDAVVLHRVQHQSGG